MVCLCECLEQAERCKQIQCLPLNLILVQGHSLGWRRGWELCWLCCPGTTRDGLLRPLGQILGLSVRPSSRRGLVEITRHLQLELPALFLHVFLLPILYQKVGSNVNQGIPDFWGSKNLIFERANG
jgi:hypothetical protein